jgi:hypothetical protein
MRFAATLFAGKVRQIFADAAASKSYASHTTSLVSNTSDKAAIVANQLLTSTYEHDFSLVSTKI